MTEPLQITLNVGNEITIPGQTIIGIMESLVSQFGEKKCIEILENSDIFLFRDGQTINNTMFPACTCEACEEMKERIREIVRKHGLNPDSVNEINRILEEHNEGDD